MDLLGDLYRTHTCGELRAEHVGQEVILLGWVHRVRDMGAVIFLDIRDRYGVTQVVTEAEPLLGQAKKLKTEMVVAVLGQVAPRAADTVNDKLETGQVEVRIGELRCLSDARRPPFQRLDHHLQLPAIMHRRQPPHILQPKPLQKILPRSRQKLNFIKRISLRLDAFPRENKRPVPLQPGYLPVNVPHLRLQKRCAITRDRRHEARETAPLRAFLSRSSAATAGPTRRR